MTMTTVSFSNLTFYSDGEFRNPELAEIVYQETAAWFRKYL